MNHKDINESFSVDFIQNEIRQSLEKHIGTTDLEAVKESLSNTLNHIYNRELITDQFKIGRCGQLWSLWSLKQKFKWYFYNKAPIVKDLSERIRNEIDDYNSLLVDPETHEYASIPKEYPEHLQPSPKSIMITDMQIKLKQSIDFITLDVTLGDK